MFKRAPVQDVQPVTGLMSFGESASLCLLPGTMPFTIPSLFFRVTFLHHFHTFPRPSKFYSLRTFKHQPLSTFAGWICRCKVFFMKKSELEMKLPLHAYFIVVFYIQICYKCTNLVSSSVIFSSSNWCQCLTLNIEKWCAKQKLPSKKINIRTHMRLIPSLVIGGHRPLNRREEIPKVVQRSGTSLLSSIEIETSPRWIRR